MANIFKGKLDIKSTSSKYAPVFVQYDHARLEIEMTDNGQPYDLSTADRVEFTHVRKDKVTITQPGEIVVTNGGHLIQYEYLGTEMDVLGRVETSFAIFDADNKKVSAHQFEVYIAPDLRDEHSNPANPNYGLLEKLQSDIDYLKENGGGGAGGIGPPGEPGRTPIKGVDYFDGSPGAKGVDGKTWHVTATTPANSLGVVGDMHLNTATFDIREKTAASVWTTRGNIKGATGPQGAPGSDANIATHTTSVAPHQYGGKFEWRYNSTTNSLDLVVLP